MTSPLPELSLCIPTKRQEQNELEDGRIARVAPVGLECLLRATRVRSGKDQALVILMKEEQWGTKASWRLQKMRNSRMNT